MLTEFERLLLDKCLAGGLTILAALREQASTSTVTERAFSPVGVSIYLSVPAHVPRVAPDAFDVSDVAFQFEGAADPGHAVLIVREGALNELMVYNWTDVWPARPNLAVKWIKYLVQGPDGSAHPAEERDFVALASDLAA